MSGEIRAWPSEVADGRIQTTLRLEQRQGLVLIVDPDAESQAAGTSAPASVVPTSPATTLAELNGVWRVQSVEGVSLDVQSLGDWARQPGMETFSGTIHYQTEFQLNDWPEKDSLFLDLGRVGNIAEVIVNGQTADVLGWAPYRMQIGHLCHDGLNQLEVRVTNSMANYYECSQSPSGLMDPVTVRCAQLTETTTTTLKQFEISQQA